jgi:SPFH domain / Band 7 family
LRCPPPLIVILVVAAVALLLLASAIRIVREYERVVVFRLGRLRGARGPGLVLIIPLIERTRWVNLQVDTADIPPQDLITKDNVTVRVDRSLLPRDRPGQGGCCDTRLPARRHAHRRRCTRPLGSTSSTTCWPTKPQSTSCSSRSSTRAPTLGRERGQGRDEGRRSSGHDEARYGPPGPGRARASREGRSQRRVSSKQRSACRRPLA